MARLARPAVAPLISRLDRLEAGLKAEQGRQRAAARKYRRELNYWRWLILAGGSEKRHGGAFHEVSLAWRRNRLLRLGDLLGLPRPDHQNDIDRWCTTRTVVEIGAGPAPTASAARLGWGRCVAVDPLARAYAEEGLLSPDAGAVVYVEAPGERIPLAGGVADLVICENCLDHVGDPGAVVEEMRRLLRPGGHVYLFVDLSEHKDAMHPHPMTEARVRGLFAAFEALALERATHAAHPKAEGALRGLFRKAEGATEAPGERGAREPARQGRVVKGMVGDAG